MARPAMTTKRRALIFERHKGTCYLCGAKIQIGEAWDAEHIIAWEISRDDSDDNLKPAHKKCHAVKTSRDRRDIAKVKRMEAKHNGTWAKPVGNSKLQSRGFPHSRDWYGFTGRDDD